jgi:DNA-binding IclR family transcriptional regulator
VWELGQHSHIHVRLRQKAQDHLTRLYEACGENVFIAVMTTTVPETAEVMFVGHVRGPRAVAVAAHEGGRFPLHSTASGRALVSAQSPHWIERYLARTFEPETVHSIVDPAALRALLATARSRGFATQLEEMTLGAAGISAPIPSGSDVPTAVVTIAAAAEHWDERRFASMIKVTVSAIAKDMRDDV